MSGADHWDAIYRRRAADTLSWFEAGPGLSAELIGAHATPGPAVDAGAGTSRLVEFLLDAGFAPVTLLDLSAAALDATRARLGARAGEVDFVVGGRDPLAAVARPYALARPGGVPLPDRRGRPRGLSRGAGPGAGPRRHRDHRHLCRGRARDLLRAAGAALCARGARRRDRPPPAGAAGAGRVRAAIATSPPAAPGSGSSSASCGRRADARVRRARSARRRHGGDCPAAGGAAGRAGGCPTTTCTSRSPFSATSPTGQAADVAEALSVVSMPRFEIALRGLDLFGGRRPGVLFIAAAGAELARLHDKITQRGARGRRAPAARAVPPACDHRAVCQGDADARPPAPRRVPRPERHLRAAAGARSPASPSTARTCAPRARCTSRSPISISPARSPCHDPQLRLARLLRRHRPCRDRLLRQLPEVHRAGAHRVRARARRRPGGAEGGATGSSSRCATSRPIISARRSSTTSSTVETSVEAITGARIVLRQEVKRDDSTAVCRHRDPGGAGRKRASRPVCRRISACRCTEPTDFPRMTRFCWLSPLHSAIFARKSHPQEMV